MNYTIEVDYSKAHSKIPLCEGRRINLLAVFKKLKHKDYNVRMLENTNNSQMVLVVDGVSCVLTHWGHINFWGLLDEKKCNKIISKHLSKVIYSNLIKREK